FRARVFAAFKSSAVHIIVLCIYLGFVAGYLNVQNVSHNIRLHGPNKEVDTGYILVLDNTILTNADVAMTWAMNLPRAYMGQWRHFTKGMLTFLKTFRAIFVTL